MSIEKAGKRKNPGTGENIRKECQHPLAKFIEQFMPSTVAFAKMAGVSEHSVRKIYAGRRKAGKKIIKKLITASMGKLTEQDFVVKK